MDDVTRQRLKHNEAVFRSVNDEIEDRAAPDHGELEYVCECADATCTAAVRLSHEEYEAVRRDADRFFVVEGHERREIERVIERHDGYLVVEKG
ncbi:MAG TPA: hypothetical protein VI408_09150 [Gaiellaceae bacterium]